MVFPKENTIIEAFVSCHFDIVAITSGYSLPMQTSRKRGVGCGHKMRLRGFEGAGANYYLHYSPTSIS
jgi:hypothetical protein